MTKSCRVEGVWGNREVPPRHPSMRSIDAYVREGGSWGALWAWAHTREPKARETA